MNTVKSLPQVKKYLWLYLSEFYLDTEHSPATIQTIVRNIQTCGYDLDSVKRINREEVLPVLYGNLLDVAGIWSGFDERELTTAITRYLAQETTHWARFKLSIINWCFRNHAASIDKELDTYWSYP